MPKKYTIIIGDIIKSKEITKRKLLQKKFNTILNAINKKYSSHIVSKFVITIGDEFQGALKDPSRSYNIISEIQAAFYPINLRFGIALGTISTPIHKEAIGMDGPGFHAAREAVEEAKKKKRNIIYKTNNTTKDLTLNTLSFAVSDLKTSWSQRQIEVVKLYAKFKTQNKVARHLKINRAVVSKILSAAKWDVLYELETTIKNLLSTQPSLGT